MDQWFGFGNWFLNHDAGGRPKCPYQSLPCRLLGFACWDSQPLLPSPLPLPPHSFCAPFEGGAVGGGGGSISWEFLFGRERQTLSPLSFLPASTLPRTAGVFRELSFAGRETRRRRQ